MSDKEREEFKKVFSENIDIITDILNKVKKQEEIKKDEEDLER